MYGHVQREVCLITLNWEWEKNDWWILYRDWNWSMSRVHSNGLYRKDIDKVTMAIAWCKDVSVRVY